MKKSDKGPKNCVVSRNSRYYTVIFNLLGTERDHIYIDVNNRKHEFSIYAGKDSKERKTASFWIFGVPHDGALEKMTAFYKGGGLQVIVPRVLKPLAA